MPGVGHDGVGAMTSRQEVLGGVALNDREDLAPRKHHNILGPREGSPARTTAATKPDDRRCAIVLPS